MIKKSEKDFVMTGSEFCPSLPSIVRSKSGIAFDPNRSDWSYRDGVHSVYMDFSELHFFRCAPGFGPSYVDLVC